MGLREIKLRPKRCQILPLRVAQKPSLKRQARKRQAKKRQVKQPQDVQFLLPEEQVARNTSRVVGAPEDPLLPRLGLFQQVWPLTQFFLFPFFVKTH